MLHGRGHTSTSIPDPSHSLGDHVSVLRLSKPLKEQYALDHNLDTQRLMDSSTYKEAYRRDMILWGEGKRDADPGYFCRLATAEAVKPVWLVCDARRPTDMEYFKTRYACLTVRVVASEETRTARGWEPTAGVDDAPSECALDNYTCDITLSNEGDSRALGEQLSLIRKRAMESISQSRTQTP